MKKILSLILVLAFLIPSFASAQANVQQGGTGLSSVSAGRLLFGSTALRLGTSANLSWDNSGSIFNISGRASSTSQTISGITGCSGSSALTTNASGAVACGAIASGAAFPFTPLTNFGINTSATSTALWAQLGLFASSTSALATTTVYDRLGVGIAPTSNSRLLLFGGTTCNDGGVMFGNNICLYRSASNQLRTDTTDDFTVGSDLIVESGNFTVPTGQATIAGGLEVDNQTTIFNMLDQQEI